MEKNLNLLYNSNGDSMKKQHSYGCQIIQQLQSHGYEAYFVGGYVRDTLLNIETQDIDITTSAKVHEVMALFDKVVLTGEKYGTVTVIIDGYHFEVTTYRKDASYSDSRRPDEVNYVQSLQEDLARRDFTINQLVMDCQGNILDHFNGKADLKKQQIKTIGDPFKRFEEDALRMLRAFRFAAKLNFTIEDTTVQAIEAYKHHLKYIAIERVQDELNKLFNYPHKTNAINTMLQVGIDQALPELLGDLNSLKNITEAYQAEDAFAIFVIQNRDCINHYKFSKKQQRTYKDIYNLYLQTENHAFQPEHIFQYGLELCLKTNKIHRLLNQNDREKAIQELDQTLPIRRTCELTFKGEDIIKTLKIKNRKQIGFIIDYLLLEVLHKRLENKPEDLKKAAETYLSKHLKEF